MPWRLGEARETLVGLVSIWSGMVGVFLCLAGILVLGWQVYVFVKLGAWLPKPLLGLVLGLVDAETSWLAHPRSYVMVHGWLTALLGMIPVSAFLIVSGLGLLGGAHKVGGRPPTTRHWDDPQARAGGADEWFGRN